jgi:two-component system chemotaxis response regulator CheY
LIGWVGLSATTPPQVSHVKKILVVDDSESIRQQVADGLIRAGFQVVEAGDGIAALQQVKEHDFAMIILDVNMPFLNGLDLLDRLKQDLKTSHIPVVMLTTEAQRSVIERARRAGAKGWLIKPIKMEDVVSTVNKLANAGETP